MSDGSGGAAATVPPVAAGPRAVLADVATSGRRRRKRERPPGESRWMAGVFMAPALILLAAILIYPLIYSIVRSLFTDNSAGGFGSFTGLDNYKSIFTDPGTLRAVKNNIIWLIVAPTLVTILGLIFAVLSERIRWATVFKTVLFMPMAISFLASGVTFALIYVDQPSRGLANTVAIGIHDIFGSNNSYPDEHAPNTSVLIGSTSAGYTTKASFAPGTPALLPLAGLDLQSPPKNLKQAALPSGPGLTGAVWNDFKLGGGGTPGKIDHGELGLAGLTVQALQNGKVVASTTADGSGGFQFAKLTSGQYKLRLPPSDFAPSFGGFSWLGPNKVTPVGPNLITASIIIAYLWIYAGFAMVLLAAGMAAIPRDTLEAARVDGATEWQVFRRVTVPQLAPVLLVVFVTLVINVLKVFDIVYVIQSSAGGNAKYADVLAVSLYDSFGTLHYGLASAIGVLLVILVLPIMALNIRRFRREQR